LVIAFAGTINPSAGSVSIFVPLEHAALTREAPDRERTKIFSRYSLVGALASAFGALAAATPDFLALAGIGQLAAIRMMFVHGVHSHPVECVSDPGGAFADASGRPDAPADTRRALADGCAGAVFLRDGRCHRGRETGRCQLHVGAPQPCCGSKSGD